jgi:glycosyltransferase involved in cell wall biosynthesis
MDLSQFKKVSAKDNSEMVSVKANPISRQAIERMIEASLAMGFAQITSAFNAKFDRIEKLILSDCNKTDTLESAVRDFKKELLQFTSVYFRDRQAERSVKSDNGKDREQFNSVNTGQSNKPIVENVSMDKSSLERNTNSDITYLLNGVTMKHAISENHLIQIKQILDSSKFSGYDEFKPIFYSFLSTCGKEIAKEKGQKVFHLVFPTGRDIVGNAIFDNWTKGSKSIAKQALPAIKTVKAESVIDRQIETFASEFKVPAKGNGSIYELINSCKGIELEENEIPSNVQKYLMEKWNNGTLTKFGLKRVSAFFDFLGKALTE